MALSIGLSIKTLVLEIAFLCLGDLVAFSITVSIRTFAWIGYHNERNTQTQDTTHKRSSNTFKYLANGWVSYFVLRRLPPRTPPRRAAFAV